MRVASLFEEKVSLVVSDLGDGNMRFLGEGKETKIISNQVKLGKEIGLEPSFIARLKTIYQDRKEFNTYKEIDRKNLSDFSILKSETEIPTTDGIATRDKNVGLLLPLADCLGIVVFDKNRNILGLLHAGRHNVEQEGPKRFIEYFKNNFGSDPKDLMIYFSPCAQNYRIFMLNNQKLPEAAKKQLLRAGILKTNVFSSKIDTVSSPDFPSYSSGDRDTRFAIAVKIMK